MKVITYFINEIPLVLVNFPIFPVPNTIYRQDYKSKDWVFLNYTYKKVEGLTQRGSIPTYMKAGEYERRSRWLTTRELR